MTDRAGAKKDVLTPRDVAGELGCSERSVYRMMESGALPYWSPTPRKRFIARATLERLVAGEAREAVAS